jgi:hypothetical protein
MEFLYSGRDVWRCPDFVVLDVDAPQVIYRRSHHCLEHGTVCDEGQGTSRPRQRENPKGID